MASGQTSLDGLGWTGGFAEAFAPHAGPGVEPARVSLAFMGGYRVLTAGGELPAVLSGKLRHGALDPAERPAVGDWVALRAPDEAGGPSLVEAVLPRATRFSRRAPGKRNTEQVLAANVDTVFLVASLDKRVRPRSFERYLVIAQQSGATPVIVLTKADCAASTGKLERSLDAVTASAPGVPVHAVSAVAPAPETHPDALLGYLEPGQTVALLGPSGAGKSTLANHWLGDDALATGEVRTSDLRGRHTTTHRHLIRLPGGAMVIDTPGLREIQLWEPESGLRDAFSDIWSLATSCRFNDCRHENEPGCAVRAAADDGSLDPGRLASFHKLTSEQGDIPLDRKTAAQGNARRRKGASYKRKPPPTIDE